MNGKMKKIGVLTGGGDCPGLNAVIRAVTLGVLREGIEVVGIRNGFEGLIENQMRPLALEDVADILIEGGTILGTSNKANPSKYAVGKDAAGMPIFRDMTGRCLENIAARGLDALVVIGGDGSMSCAEPLSAAGVNCIGVPKTIDNDLYGTDRTFGFLTAVSIATEALDRLHTTAASHHRAIVVEVMGRNAGWIALFAGIAGAADIVLIPEIPFDMESVRAKVVENARGRRGCSLICVAEGSHARDGTKVIWKLDPTSPDPVRLGGIAKMVAEQIEATTGVESRHVVLGHVQRGGTPNAADRVLATQFGYSAGRLLQSGAKNRMVALQAGRMTDIPITEPAHRQRLIGMDDPVLASARTLGMCFGD